MGGGTGSITSGSTDLPYKYFPILHIGMENAANFSCEKIVIPFKKLNMDSYWGGDPIKDMNMYECGYTSMDDFDPESQVSVEIKWGGFKRCVPSVFSMGAFFCGGFIRHHQKNRVRMVQNANIMFKWLEVVSDGIFDKPTDQPSGDTLRIPLCRLYSMLRAEGKLSTSDKDDNSIHLVLGFVTNSWHNDMYRDLVPKMNRFIIDNDLQMPMTVYDDDDNLFIESINLVVYSK